MSWFQCGLRKSHILFWDCIWCRQCGSKECNPHKQINMKKVDGIAFLCKKKRIIWSFLRLTKAAVIEGKKNNICLWDSCSESLFFTEPMWSITVNKLIDYYYSWAIWHTSLFLNAQIKLSNNLDEDDGTMRERECSSEGGKWIFLFYDWIDTNVSFMHGNDSWFNIPVIVIISI